MKYNICRLIQGGAPLIAGQDGYSDYEKSVTALLKEAKEPAIIVFDGLNLKNTSNFEELFNNIRQLRQSPVFYAAPIFLTSSAGRLDSFVDGVYNQYDQIMFHGSSILDKLKTISVSNNSTNNDLRLLTFMYARKDEQILTPVPFVTDKYIYEYQAAYLISNFTDANNYYPDVYDIDNNGRATRENTSTARWVNTLYSQGFLAPRGLVDRIRSCPYCHASVLNYLDYCHLCGSINFEKKKMIHCFTCGNVAPQDEFRSGMMLRCPRCDTALRHIGADYDRPLESYQCNDCGEKFIEPEIKAVCINCGKSTPTDELNILQLYSFVLTVKGEKAVQSGSLDLEISLFDGNNNVIPAYFYQVLNWLILVKARYPEDDFSLIGIKIAEKQSARGTVSSLQLNSIVDEFAVRIKELIRSTDITTNTGNNTFWLLLPRTSYLGGEILSSKIQKISSMISQTVSDYIELQVKCFPVSADYKGNNEAAIEALIRSYETEF